MNHIGSVQLETERLILRRFTVADAPQMFTNWASDAEVTKYLMWPTHTSVDDSRNILTEWIPNYDKPDYYHWGIVIKEANTLIGSTAAVKQDDKAKLVHIGYCIGRTWWHKGYTSEVLKRLVRFFFEDVGVNRVESRHDPRNPNSGKVMQKAGLRYEGTSIASDWNNQGICDAANYAILANEYFRKPNTTKITDISYCAACKSDFDVVADLLCELYIDDMGIIERD
jgi:ribosomal-protein-alanine N-acetyltransferase